MNTVKAVITKGSHRVRTSPLWQYDYGQILQIVGLELPAAYEVHFSNSENGNSTTSIGNSDGVVIPDAYLQSGENVYAWLYLHTGEADGETVYHIQIPVKKRAGITDQQPTPVQQDVITQTIAALDAAVEGVPTAIDEALKEAKASGEFDGYSPTITVEDITGGHRVTITDVNGTQTVDVMDGEKGDPGDPGEDGYSPSISVSNITGGHRVTVTNKTGSSSFDVMDGQDGDPGAPGQDGVSPVATVTKSGKVATITVTDKTGTTTATVSDGEDGSPGDPTELIDDTAGSGTTNKTWSANKLTSALNQKQDETGFSIVDGKVCITFEEANT